MEQESLANAKVSARSRAGFSSSRPVWGTGLGAEGAEGGAWGGLAPSQNSPSPEIFVYSLVYKWLVLVHSETNFYTGRRAILNARSSNVKVNKAVETNSK